MLASVAFLGACNAGRIVMNGEEPEWMADAGTMNPDAGALPPEESEPEARDYFDAEVAPMLADSCAGCHTGVAGPAFLAEPMYPTLMTYGRAIDRESPADSLLVAKGRHSGLTFWWSDAQRETLVEWIGLEAGVEPPTEEEEELARDRETDPLTPVAGLNLIDLTGSAPGVDGGQVSFWVEQTEYGVFLDDITITAGTSGLRAVHPTLVVWDGALGTPDPADQFSDYDLRLAPGEREVIGDYSVPLFPDAGRISLLFEAIGPYGGPSTMEPPTGEEPEPGETPPATGGCRVVSMFSLLARPHFSNNCARCHAGTNPTAMAAVDMSRIDDLTPDGQQAVCNQILGRIDLDRIPETQLFAAPDAASGIAHDFKFPSPAALAAFRDDVTSWAEQEAM